MTICWYHWGFYFVNFEFIDLVVYFSQENYDRNRQCQYFDN